jgi:hypothetical protein
MLSVVIIISFRLTFPWGTGEPNGKGTIVLKQTMAVAALMLASIGYADAQPAASPNPAPATPAYQATLASCQVYEARMHRMAQMNKVLGASYNATRVINDCMANPSLAAQ